MSTAETTKVKVPQAKVGDIVLVTTSGGGQGGGDWYPAFVSKASDSSNGETNIEVYGTHLGLEGYKHEDDEWWKRDDAQNIATDDGVGVWKYSDQQVRINQLLELAPALLRLVPRGNLGAVASAK